MSYEKIDFKMDYTYYIIKMDSNMDTQKPPVDSLLDRYIKSLSDKEYQGYMIAKSHLGSSFDLEKSTGFREWKQNNAPK
jgi:hypothetical protein